MACTRWRVVIPAFRPKPQVLLQLVQVPQSPQAQSRGQPEVPHSTVSWSGTAGSQGAPPLISASTFRDRVLLPPAPQVTEQVLHSSQSKNSQSLGQASCRDNEKLTELVFQASCFNRLLVASPLIVGRTGAVGALTGRRCAVCACLRSRASRRTLT